MSPLHDATAGRTCPLRYRYGPQAIANAPTRNAEVLYVIGGLYGNVAALDVIEQMAAQETGAVTLCFNGDFNWFNVDDAGFREVNTRVLRHHAIAGNVEAELPVEGDDAGCGCAYPPEVSGEVVQRSNRIHARLKATAQQHPDLLAQLGALPMLARYQVGDCRVGVVHGDADSLAGWRFAVDQIGQPAQAAWLAEAFNAAQVDVFASTHTCEPVLHHTPMPQGAVVINNGAAGMPNAGGTLPGLITRVSARPSPHAASHGAQIAGVHVDALPVHYDQARWLSLFTANWPAQSDAHASYFGRISGLRTALHPAR